MISVKLPEIYRYISENFHGGLLPIKLENGKIFLIIKAPKEYILTAKVRKEFKIYLVPVTVQGKDSFSIITAFFDDADEPLVIRTPLFFDDLSEHFREMLLSEKIEVYFFDETNVEYLGYSARFSLPENSREVIADTEFFPFSNSTARSVITQLDHWFGHRQADDDGAALSVVLEEALYPEDFTIVDARQLENRFVSTVSIPVNSLERSEPGEYQERDIANLLARIYPANRIYLNPLKGEDSEEISDLLLIGENILFVQAKDSPNVEKILGNSVARKKSTTLRHLDKALNQVSGAVKYARRSEVMSFLVGNRKFSVRVSGVKIVALVVVKELFFDDYHIYTDRVLAVAKNLGVTCIPVEFNELHSYTMNLHSEESLFDAIDFVFDKGLESGRFPRLRFGLSDG